MPTRDESGNVAALLSRLGPVLTVVNGEVLFVYDSDNDTPSVIVAAGRASGGPVWMLHRAPGKRLGGLGGAGQAGLATVTVQLARSTQTLKVAEYHSPASRLR